MTDQDKQFIADLLREDDVGLVLRGHLHVEHQLIQLISALLPFADRCDWEKISYRSKIEIAHGCGLSADLKQLLVKLGSLRNTFAHTLAASIEKQSILDLYNSLSARLRDGLTGSYGAMGLPVNSTPSSFSPRDLLILLFLSARQATKAAAIALKAQP